MYKGVGNYIRIGNAVDYFENTNNIMFITFWAIYDCIDLSMTSVFFLCLLVVFRGVWCYLDFKNGNCFW